MLFYGAQHVCEAAGHVRTDRLALERARGGVADVALGDRYSEVVGPERDEPLDKADRRGRRPGESRGDLGAKVFLFDGRRGGHHRACRRRRLRRPDHKRRDARRRHCRTRQLFDDAALALHLLEFLIGVDRLQDGRSALERLVVDDRALRRREFGKQRRARIGGAGKIPGPRPKAEAVEGGQQMGSERVHRSNHFSAPPRAR
jgi:hypothetical protein